MQFFSSKILLKPLTVNIAHLLKAFSRSNIPLNEMNISVTKLPNRARACEPAASELYRHRAAQHHGAQP